MTLDFIPSNLESNANGKSCVLFLTDT